MRWYSSLLHVQSFRGVDSDTDDFPLTANVRERLSVRKQAAQNTDMARSNLNKLSELMVRKQFQIELSNRFAALGKH
jgi:hypothetical protein